MAKYAVFAVCGLWLGYLLSRLAYLRRLSVSFAFAPYLTWGRQLKLKHWSEYENHCVSSAPLLFTLFLILFFLFRLKYLCEEMRSLIESIHVWETIFGASISQTNIAIFYVFLSIYFRLFLSVSISPPFCIDFY